MGDDTAIEIDPLALLFTSEVERHLDMERLVSSYPLKIKMLNLLPERVMLNLTEDRFFALSIVVDLDYS